MDSYGFDPDRESESGGRPDLPASAEESPTVPGLDPTQHFDPAPQTPAQEPSPGAASAPAAENQPKWQPLPGGHWAPPGSSQPPATPAGASYPDYSGRPSHGGTPAGAPGYGPSAGGYGPPGYGPPPGYGASWAAGYGPSEAGRTPPRRTGRIVITGLAVAVLVAAAASIGVVVGSSSQPSSNAPATASQKIPGPSASDGTATKLNVAAIAKKVDPETVDITSVLGTEDAEAMGTGIILTSNGEVLTNNHVIDGATKITAQVDGAGTKYTVNVLGTDVVDDVALVQLEGASNLPHVTVGNSSDLAVGDPVVAIGNALGLGGTPTVTSGIVSALGRAINASDEGSSTTEHLTGMVQTDAPINPGNSGGPLVDAAGQVIGMDTAALSSSGTATASNVGFAIPINRALSIAQAIQQGKASSTILIGPKGILGVDVESISTAEQGTSSEFPFDVGGGATPPVKYGAYVAQIVNGSPAQSAGLATGDVIIALNGKRVSTPTALGDDLAGDKPGTTVSVTWVTSSGAQHTSSLTLEADPQAA